MTFEAAMFIFLHSLGNFPNKYTLLQIDFKYLRQNTFLICVAKDFNSQVEH